jgi:hypothetical protein
VGFGYLGHTGTSVNGYNVSDVLYTNRFDANRKIVRGMNRGNTKLRGRGDCLGEENSEDQRDLPHKGMRTA